MVCCYFVHDAYIEMAAGELWRLCRWRGKTGTQVWQVIAAPVPALAWDCYHLVDTGLKTVALEPTAELCLNDLQSLHQPSLYSPATQLSLFLDTHRVSRFGQKKSSSTRTVKDWQEEETPTPPPHPSPIPSAGSTIKDSQTRKKCLRLETTQSYQNTCFVMQKNQTAVHSDESWDDCQAPGSSTKLTFTRCSNRSQHRAGRLSACSMQLEILFINICANPDVWI